MKQHIHIFGASGSGTTTISKLVSQQLGYRHFDSDNYFWLPTVEPFTAIREQNECLEMMDKDLSENDKWVLSGSIANWGNILIPHFDLAVFVYVPPEIRLQRLENREFERYGEEMLPGGRLYEKSQEFLLWAAKYDKGTGNGRSLERHENWLNNINCSTLRIDNIDLKESAEAVVDAIIGKTDT